MKKIIYLCVLVAFHFPAGLNAQRLFVKFDNLLGPSTNFNYRGWSEFLTLTHRIETPNTALPNTSLSTEAFNNRPGLVTITMKQDKTSTFLHEAAASGRPLRTVAIVASRGNEQRPTEVKYIFTDVVVQAINFSAETNNGTANVNESITFTYRSFTLEHAAWDHNLSKQIRHVTGVLRESDFRKIKN